MSETLFEKQTTLCARDIWKSFEGGAIEVLRGVSLEAHAGEMLALWGRSGSGKSTLLHLLGGLDNPDKGTLNVCGIDPTQESQRLKLRREMVGFVFQLHNLIANLTLEENCLLPAIACGLTHGQARERFGFLAEATGLSSRKSQRIQKLSGGERQRTALCRALMHHPKVLLADEPTGALDEHTGNQIFDLMQGLCRDQGITILMATHERRFAEACDRILVVRDGRIEKP